MALNDLIATMGARNYETMRRGWLPTKDERQIRELRNLNIQSAQQKVDYEPERQRMKSRKSDGDYEYTTATTKRINQQIKKAKTDADWKEYTNNFEITSNFIRGAYNIYEKTNDINQAKELIRDNYPAIIKAGDDGSDKAVERFLSGDISDEEAIKLLSRINSIMPSVQKQLDKENLVRMKGARGGSNSSVVLEYARRIANDEYLTPEEWNHYNKLTNTTATKTSVNSLKYKTKNDKNNAMLTSRKTAVKAMKSTVDTNTSIRKAFQALESGDNTLSDKLLTSALSNLTDSSVRAFKMYEVFDSSLGNIVEQFQDWIDRGVSGTRNPEQKAKILLVLQKMKKYNEPVMKKLRKHHRAIARADGHDPYKVVPPKTKEEVAEDTNLTIEEKIKLLKQYGLFKKQ